MKESIRQQLRRRKRKIQKRLETLDVDNYGEPVMQAAQDIQYEIAERTQAISAGGIGALHRLADKVGLVEAINRRIPLFKVYLPYRESDHVLNIAYNLLAGGTRMEHIELRRQDEVFLNALGASRIPDPTTARDFCQRFTEDTVLELMEAINDARLVVWQQQPEAFFDVATLDVDGTIAPTYGECKAGMELAYNGEWGFHPAVVSLANTQEPLYLVNRPGNRPSHEGCHVWLDRAIALCRRAGFRRVRMRGDTDFSQTKFLDAWDANGVGFIFGYDAAPNLVALANALPATAWQTLPREKPQPAGPPRAKQEQVKQPLVDEHGFQTIATVAEQVAEFDYQPTACRQAYRMVVVRKQQTVRREQELLFEKSPYFFYITNERAPTAAEIERAAAARAASNVASPNVAAAMATEPTSAAIAPPPTSVSPSPLANAPSTPCPLHPTAAEIVLAPHGANGRCQQENLLDQLKHGVRALDMPTNNLVSNWAYLVMASLAWTLKTWFGLLLPEEGRWSETHRAEKAEVLKMEFRGFLTAFVLLPCQIARSGRRLFYRFLSWNRWQTVFFRLLDRLDALPHLTRRRQC